VEQAMPGKSSMGRTKRRSICPVACALDLFGDKWTLLLIRDMACGKTLFKDFATSPERIATNILAARLERLLASGLAESFLPGDGGRGGLGRLGLGRLGLLTFHLGGFGGSGPANTSNSVLLVLLVVLHLVRLHPQRVQALLQLQLLPQG